jgi:hypothetical protein
MAQRIETLLIDDLDGREAHQTVKFGFEGNDYEIDLSNMHTDAMREALATYVEHARIVSRGAGRGGATGRTRRSGRDANALDTNACREWLKTHGYEEVKDRGRIPADLVAVYLNRDSASTTTQAPVPPLRLVEPEAPKEATKPATTKPATSRAKAKPATPAPEPAEEAGAVVPQARAPRKPRAARA